MLQHLRERVQRGLLLPIVARGEQRVEAGRDRNALLRKLTDQGSHHELRVLLLDIVEVEEEVCDDLAGVTFAVLEDISENSRAEDGFAASWNAIQPEKRCGTPLPLGILAAFEKPKPSVVFALLERFLVVRRMIWCG